MEGIDFCEEFKKSTGKHEGLVHFEKKLGIPPYSIDGICFMNILPADSGSFQVWNYNFVINIGCTFLNKSLKSADKGFIVTF